MNRTRSTSARPARRRPHSSGTPDLTELVQPARTLWLAGLGAAVTAGEVAVAVADRLVTEGRAVEPAVAAKAREVATETRERLGSATAEVTSRVRDAAEGAFERAGFTPRRQKNLFHRIGDLAEAIL